MKVSHRRWNEISGCTLMPWSPNLLAVFNIPEKSIWCETVDKYVSGEISLSEFEFLTSLSEKRRRAAEDAAKRKRLWEVTHC